MKKFVIELDLLEAEYLLGTIGLGINEGSDHDISCKIADELEKFTNETSIEMRKEIYNKLAPNGEAGFGWLFGMSREDMYKKYVEIFGVDQS